MLFSVEFENESKNVSYQMFFFFEPISEVYVKFLTLPQSSPKIHKTFASHRYFFETSGT